MATITQSASATKPGTVIKIPKDLAAMFDKEKLTPQHVVFVPGFGGPAPGYQMLSEALIMRLARDPVAMKAILSESVVVVVPKEQIQL